MEMGIPDDRILLCEDGDVVELTDAGVDFAGEVPAGYLYVDGIVGDVGRGVLRDRRVLAEEGVVIVVVTIDARSGEIVAGPELITRGWVYAPEADSLLEEARKVITISLEEVTAKGTCDVDTLRRHVRQATGRFVSERTRRRPMILPIVMEV
jgi:ribonuclease J